MATPKLRFKEFDNDWYLTSFQNLFTFKNGVNASKEQYGSGIKFINVLDIINNPNGIIYESIIGSVDITSKEINKNLVKYGDVLFQRSSETREEVGQSNVYLGEQLVVFGGFVIRGSAKQVYDPVFMNGLLKTDYLRDQITQLSGGSTRFNIGQDSLNKVSAYLPSKEEQTKIASFLSAVDEKISQLTQKYELLSQYKQGMMQKLFSQQIRFKADDGSEFGEWDQKELKEVAQINPKAKKLPENFIYIDLESVEKGQLLFEKNITLSEAPSRAQRLLAKGDVLFQMVRPYQQNNYYFNLDGQYVASTGYAQIRTELNSKFIYYAIHEKEFLDEVMNRCTGTSYPAINSSDLSTIEIGIPCLEEQMKISNFLSAIDQKIEKVTQQIEGTKQWKKGLLQQMFI
ncbi:restriction endonuclease subunit S [Acinetobacter guillouiae]|uniref:restriction endonuclease subunit S n=1 Tax=Acinetobacter guillouiae TaxID=106649 RepID=UPI0021D183AA|nr:restriction endonuclease subunit S [Acinetobacter guillouiae]MCU4492809.1 restriction endonuclease subunit S [Acinetobacter guillouiae]